MTGLTDQDLVYIQNRLSHEDDLINQRISWLVNSQSFLLTAYAITLNGLAADQTKPLAYIQRKLLSLLPLVGIGCVLLVCVALIGGLMAMGELRRFARTKLPKDRLFLISRPTTQYLGVSAPVFIPVVFLVIWGVLYF
ncbi:MAG TPA: hypothetical protein VE860_19605 [Chthoniobacterales bacterium]|jgi:uncharacterized membrane protein YidH (DUF202 family)|nr:hypothetical protein [Chthoniobacterales bacterium]